MVVAASTLRCADSFFISYKWPFNVNVDTKLPLSTPFLLGRWANTYVKKKSFLFKSSTLYTEIIHTPWVTNQNLLFRQISILLSPMWSVWVCFCCGLWWFVNIPFVNIIIILHYMWVVGIDGCAPMNMTMVKNDIKNKERERFSGNFQVILFMTKRHFFMTSSSTI